MYIGKYEIALGGGGICKILGFPGVSRGLGEREGGAFGRLDYVETQ